MAPLPSSRQGVGLVLLACVCAASGASSELADAFLGKTSSLRACQAFGRGSMDTWSDCSFRALRAGEIPQVEPLQGTVTWAVKVPGTGTALCDETRSILILHIDGTGQMVEVPLGPLSNPVGAVFFDGKVWVACFGSHTQPGLAVVDPVTRTLEATYPFPTFVHNVYAFNWGGAEEIFIANLGNPWSNPPKPGKGLVRFDRASRTFVTDTTVGDLYARSAKQDSEGVFYALTQEPHGAPTNLVRLEQQEGKLAITSSTKLPPRSGGDGGADVFLGRDKDTVFCTDRTEGMGKLYFYVFGHGAFTLRSTTETGHNPRYTTMLPSGDIVACNQNENGTLTVFQGLGLHPTETENGTLTVKAAPQVSFFLPAA